MPTPSFTITFPPGFDERQALLEFVIRYHPYKPMFYRTNLWMHGHRLMWMIEDIAKEVQTVFPFFDKTRAQLMALIHDDLEIVMGDVQLNDKLAMTAEQKKQLDETEEKAMEEISSRFPESIGKYSYKKLLKRYNQIDVNDIEAVVVKYCDKMDGYCEALHELFAGNNVFATPLHTNTIPTDVYPSILQNFEKTFPLFAEIRHLAHPLFSLPQELDVASIVANGTRHTPTSLHVKTGVMHYDAWKNITQKYGGDFGMKMLVEQRER